MCTCGIDIATQQATPATQSSAWAAFIDRPNGRCASACRRRARPSTAAASAGGRARMQQGEQRHRRGAEDAHADVGLAPADGLDEVLHDRRPDRAGEVVAAGADRHRGAAPLDEPERGVGDQRREGRRAAGQAEQQAVDDREGEDAAAQAGEDEAGGQADRADQDRQHHAAPVGQAAHEDAADAEADHQQRVGQRRRRRGRRRIPSAPKAARPRRRTSRRCRSSSAPGRRSGGSRPVGNRRGERRSCGSGRGEKAAAILNLIRGGSAAGLFVARREPRALP